MAYDDCKYCGKRENGFSGMYHHKRDKHPRGFIQEEVDSWVERCKIKEDDLAEYVEINGFVSEADTIDRYPHLHSMALRRVEDYTKTALIREQTPEQYLKYEIEYAQERLVQAQEALAEFDALHQKQEA